MARFRPSLRLALTLSLALNLFLLAVLAAPHLFPPSRERGEARFIERITRRLPEADRPAFREAHERHAERLRQAIEAMRESRAGMRAALGAEPYDPEALARAAETWRQASDAARQVFESMIQDAAPAMSPEGRVALVPGRRRD